MSDIRIKSHPLQQLVDEIAAHKSPNVVLTGGSTMMAVIAEAVMDRLGITYEGKARVNIDLEAERVRIILTWPEEQADGE